MTRVSEPSDGDERTVLFGWLAFHRDALAAKCSGLDDDKLVLASAPPSPMSLLGLVRHLTEMDASMPSGRSARRQSSSTCSACTRTGVPSGTSTSTPRWSTSRCPTGARASGGGRALRRPLVARRRGVRQRVHGAVEPAEAGRRVCTPQRARRHRPGADRWQHGRVTRVDARTSSLRVGRGKASPKRCTN